MKAIYGKKVGMTRVFTEEGENIPVTVLQLGPNVVHQVKTLENDGYPAVQVGYGSQKPQRLTRPMSGHLSKAKKGFPNFVREIRFDKAQLLSRGQNADVPEYNVGDEILLEGLFDVGSKVDVVGTSLGKGFAGVVKKYGMKGAATKTHGTHEYFRHAGSIGCRKSPGRVWKNKRMPGHMGTNRIVQEALEVVSIHPEDNLMLVKGSVPGPKDSVILVRESIKQKRG